MSKKLDQKLVTQYGTKSGELRVLKQWMEEKRELILKLFGKGFVCPTAGPYVLEVEIQRRLDIDWRELLGEYLTDQFGKEEAIERILHIEKHAKKQRIKCLKSKINPAWRRRR